MLKIKYVFTATFFKLSWNKNEEVFQTFKFLFIYILFISQTFTMKHFLNIVHNVLKIMSHFPNTIFATYYLKQKGESLPNWLRRITDNNLTITTDEAIMVTWQVQGIRESRKRQKIIVERLTIILIESNTSVVRRK